MNKVKIRAVKAFVTAPDDVNLIVVKVETDEPELFGLGCATFTYREKAVVSIIEDYLTPLLVGRFVEDIGELWQLMYQNGYWRNDVISNNAIAGVDMALWDIKGKMADMPLYSLLGGKYREGVPYYRHASGETLEELDASIAKHIQEGVRHIRIQWGHYGGVAESMNRPTGHLPGDYYHPQTYIKRVVQMFEHVRDTFGYDLELLHDVHERLKQPDALWLAKELEPFRLFYLEDLLPPEHMEGMAQIRHQVTTPLAMGELFTHPKEWQQVIANRWIDYIRVHISMIGGITPALTLVHFAECYNVLTAWHGPIDQSPIGHAVNMHMDLATKNFGIQEWYGIGEKTREVFGEIPTLREGYIYPNVAPGIGVTFDEEKAKAYPYKTRVTTWTQTRIEDGSLMVP